MRREPPVRIREGLGVQLPRATRLLLGFTGPLGEAGDIKRRIGEFLRDHLKLELSETKTLVTHARTEPARFLGYEIVILGDDSLRRKDGSRIGGNVGLKVPATPVRERCAAHLRCGKPVHRHELVNESEFSIVSQFQREFRGFAEYYKLAYNRSSRLNRLRWVMESALTRTLASKLKISVRQVYDRFGATIQAAEGPLKGLEVRVARAGKSTLVARWGGVTLARQKIAILDDQIPFRYATRVELLERLLADACELCGSRDQIQVHHVRHLKDVWRRREGRNPPPNWVVVMSSRRRKTLVVCHRCHVAIHNGELQRQQPT